MMIEKVARAVCRNLKMPEEMWSNEVFLSIARDAIAAMREPTDEMLRAVTADRLLPPQYAMSATDYWQAMIDAALKEGK